MRGRSKFGCPWGGPGGLRRYRRVHDRLRSQNSPECKSGSKSGSRSQQREGLCPSPSRPPRATPSGPHLNTWIDAADLNTGQYLQTSAGTRIQITAITQRTTQATVHNLTVAGTHTYYVVAGAAPVLVHNCGTTPPGVQCNCAPGTGAGPADAPIRNSGAWTRSGVIRGSLGLRPNQLGNRIEIHHADQMPGSAIHELDQNVHRGAGTNLHRNPHNQGVTKDMRKEDTQLHWWYRSQEQGWGAYSPDRWFDNWPGDR
ncbi:polymorphic toxin-type HINT domain-containing protein [Streptomyces albidoflavus]